MFYFWLAAEKMHMPVGLMLSCMDSMELTRWMAFYEIEKQTLEEHKKKTEGAKDNMLTEQLKGSLISAKHGKNTNK